MLMTENIYLIKYGFKINVFAAKCRDQEDGDIWKRQRFCNSSIYMTKRINALQSKLIIFRFFCGGCL